MLAFLVPVIFLLVAIDITEDSKIQYIGKVQITLEDIENKNIYIQDGNITIQVPTVVCTQGIKKLYIIDSSPLGKDIRKYRLDCYREVKDLLNNSYNRKEIKNLNLD